MGYFNLTRTAYRVAGYCLVCLAFVLIWGTARSFHGLSYNPSMLSITLIASVLGLTALATIVTVGLWACDPTRNFSLVPSNYLVGLCAFVTGSVWGASYKLWTIFDLWENLGLGRNPIKLWQVWLAFVGSLAATIFLLLALLWHSTRSKAYSRSEAMSKVFYFFEMIGTSFAASYFVWAIISS